MSDTYPKNTIDDNGLKKVWDMVMDRLGLKVDKEAGKGLSTNDYTTAEKNKLAGIASGAEVNTVTSVAGKTGAVTLDKSDVGLSNVGNFKAVSTSANQGLTNTEKSNARANIDTPSNGDIQSSKTVSGNVVTVTDAAPINAEDITVDITPVQDLHGYDRPWAGGAWKNKLPNRSFISQGITFNSDNYTGTVMANGIPSAGGWDNGTYYAEVLPAGTYIVSCVSNPNNLCVLKDWDNQGSINQEGKSITLNGSEILRIAWFTTKRQSIDYSVTGLMIRLATETDPTFAPYSNICPIEGRTGAKLDRDGKNWLNSDDVQNKSVYVDSSNRVICANDNTRLIACVKVYSGKSYVYSWDSTKFKVVSAFYFNDKVLPVGVVGLNTELNYVVLENTAGVYSFTAQRDSYLYFYMAPVASQATVSPSDLEGSQIELGTTATPYEPYQGQQYTASFGETVYGGKWHVTEGGTDNEMAKVDLGSLTWIYQSVYQRFYAPLVSAKAVPNDQVANALCTQYELIEVDGTVTSNDGVIGISANRNVIVRDTRYTDAAAFKTAVTGVQLAYELATPTTISTPKQNVPMLQGINTVYADCGDTSLKYQPDNVVGELKGEIEDSIIYEDYKWTTESSRTYSAGTPGTYGCSSWRDVKKEGYDVIGVTFVENRRFGDCILTLYYIPSTSRVEVIIFRATSSAVTIADEDIEYRVAYKKRT